MQAPASQDWATIPEIVNAAQAKIPQNLWDYSCGGAETETTLRRNRAGFDYLALRPRILAGPDPRDFSTTFLGQRLALPVMLAPIGGIQHYDPEGGVAVARAAERSGSVS